MDFEKDRQYWKFCSYGFLKNLRFFDPFIILFFREVGFSFLEIGILFSVRELSTNILEIPSGIAADVAGRRRSMIFSFGCYIFAFLLFYFFSYFSVYIFAMIVFAMGEAFRTGTHKAMILDYLKIKGWQRWKVYYYGHTRSWSQRGSALSSLIAAGLVFYSGTFRVVFAYSVVPYVVGILLFLTYPKELDGKTARGFSLRGRGNMLTPWKDAVLGLAGLAKSPKARRTFLSSSLFDGFFKAQKDYIQPMLQGLALGLPLLLSYSGEERIALITGGVYFILYAATAFITGKAGHVASRLGSLPFTLNTTYLLGAALIMGLGLFYRSELILPAVGIFIIYYMLENLRRPIALGYMTESIKNEIMATGLSGESQLKTIFVALLAPALGFMADKIGLGGALFVFGAAAAVLYPVVYIRNSEA